MGYLVIFITFTTTSCLTLKIEPDYCFFHGICNFKLTEIDDDPVVCSTVCPSDDNTTIPDNSNTDTVELAGNCSVNREIACKVPVTSGSPRTLQLKVTFCNNQSTCDFDSTVTFDVKYLPEPIIDLGKVDSEIYDNIEHTLRIGGTNFNSLYKPEIFTGWIIANPFAYCYCYIQCNVTDSESMFCVKKPLLKNCTLDMDKTMHSYFFSHGRKQRHEDVRFFMYKFPRFKKITWNAEESEIRIHKSGSIILNPKALCSVTKKSDSNEERIESPLKSSQSYMYFKVNTSKYYKHKFTCKVLFDTHQEPIGSVYIDKLYKNSGDFNLIDIIVIIGGGFVLLVIALTLISLCAISRHKKDNSYSGFNAFSGRNFTLVTPSTESRDPGTLRQQPQTFTDRVASSDGLPKVASKNNLSRKKSSKTNLIEVKTSQKIKKESTTSLGKSKRKPAAKLTINDLI